MNNYSIGDFQSRANKISVNLDMLFTMDCYNPLLLLSDTDIASIVEMAVNLQTKE